MKPHALWIGAAVLLSACSDGTGPRIERLRTALAQANVSLRESVAAGESNVTGGTAVRAELLVVADPEYAVRALGGGTMHDVRVDIVSGAILSARVLGLAADPCPGSIPLSEAIAIAERHAQGRAVLVQPDDDDQCLREVQVLGAGELWEVKLARDGQVLETEVADGDDN